MQYLQFAARNYTILKICMWKKRKGKVSSHASGLPLCFGFISVHVFQSRWKQKAHKVTHPRRSTSGLRQTWLFFQTKGDRRWNLIFLKQNRVFQTWVAMLIIFTPDGFFKDLTRRRDTYIVLVAYWNNLAVFVWFRFVLGKTSPQQRNVIPSSAWLS